MFREWSDLAEILRQTARQRLKTFSKNPIKKYSVGFLPALLKNTKAR
jgi:hypothetical protein